MISRQRLSRFQQASVGQNLSLATCNVLHWRLGELYRIFQVWLPSRRNAIYAHSVGICGRTSPAVYRADNQEKSDARFGEKGRSCTHARCVVGDGWSAAKGL